MCLPIFSPTCELVSEPLQTTGSVQGCRGPTRGIDNYTLAPRFEYEICDAHKQRLNRLQMCLQKSNLCTAPCSLASPRPLTSCPPLYIAVASPLLRAQRFVHSPAVCSRFLVVFSRCFPFSPFCLLRCFVPQTLYLGFTFPDRDRSRASAAADAAVSEFVGSSCQAM